jgi:hypothetical protein|uniref:Uncharacterized protein n=2 Tax=Oryza sativa subsp. japonica TaxID=39947 RepID=Q2R6J3_ORYSJ|nr:hypothetical protein LOC_Os11g19850 [Oryza sativa Japonica Group]ABA92997.1 hypothetical protein LOC_Os11g19850 [Oryza sativa Japonica Group]
MWRCGCGRIWRGGQPVSDLAAFTLDPEGEGRREWSWRRRSGGVGWLLGEAGSRQVEEAVNPAYAESGRLHARREEAGHKELGEASGVGGGRQKVLVEVAGGEAEKEDGRRGAAGAVRWSRHLERPIVCCSFACWKAVGHDDQQCGQCPGRRRGFLPTGCCSLLPSIGDPTPLRLAYFSRGVPHVKERDTGLVGRFCLVKIGRPSTLSAPSKSLQQRGVWCSKLLWRNRVVELGVESELLAVASSATITPFSRPWKRLRVVKHCGGLGFVVVREQEHG